uniref:Uncharacterized protein n=1 Tax=Amphimedon queenslandica TaxID=400682 RepID=A0A1X7TME4_AMPQE
TVKPVYSRHIGSWDPIILGSLIHSHIALVLILPALIKELSVLFRVSAIAGLTV